MDIKQIIGIIIIVLLFIIVIILSVLLISFKIQIKKVTNKLKIILEDGTKELVTISLGDKCLENLAEIINDILIKYSRQLIDIKRQENILKENIACLSHDLRTPLTSIKGYLKLMKNSPSDKIPEYINVLDKKAFRLGRFIEDYYQISLLDNNNYSFEYETIDICSLLTEILLENYALFKEKTISPVIDIPDGIVYIYSDKTACIRIIQNLLFNALDKTSGGIDIQLVKEYSKICLVVRNPVNASVIPCTSRVFDRFYMEDGTLGNGHSGQGLYIVKKLLTEMGCEEPAASISDNCFSIYVKWKITGRGF